HNAVHNHVTAETVQESVKRLCGLAQHFHAQGADGIYLFNHPCLLYETNRKPADFETLAGVLSELGSPETLAGKERQYTFWKELPLQIESRRPPEYHQTIRFTLLDPEVPAGKGSIQLQFRQMTEAN